MTYPPATRGMTSHPAPIPDPEHPSENTVCSRCGCFWRIDSSGEQPKDEWCAETRDGSCQCHSDFYVGGYLNALDDLKGNERVIAFVEPFCRVAGCDGDPRVPGTARGLCVKHYSRMRRNGLCQSIGDDCERPAISHLGLCEQHMPAGIPA